MDTYPNLKIDDTVTSPLLVGEWSVRSSWSGLWERLASGREDVSIRPVAEDHDSPNYINFPRRHLVLKREKREFPVGTVVQRMWFGEPTWFARKMAAEQWVTYNSLGGVMNEGETEEEFIESLGDNAEGIYKVMFLEDTAPSGLSCFTDYINGEAV